MLDPSSAQTFLRSLFGHELLAGPDASAPFHIGVSAFPPKHGKHAWHTSPENAAAWAMGEAGANNVYFRTTLVANPPATGRGDATVASALVGFHADIDIAHEVHTKTNLPPDEAAARKIIELVGLRPTIIVHSGHGLQAHWLLTEPWIFAEGDLERATELVKRFGATITACAESLGFGVDTVADLARILRLPGTVNRKAQPVPVRVLEENGPRYDLADLEAIMVELTPQRVEHVEVGGEPRVMGSPLAPLSPLSPQVGLQGSDEELLQAARRAKNGPMFRALFDRGELQHHGNDASKADWHLVDKLSFWCGPDAERIDRLFRQSKLMRGKWEEIHGTGGVTYGQMTIADVLGKRTTYFSPRERLPRIVVTNRQLRDQSAEALDALEAANDPPTLFQRGGKLVRVKLDATSGAHSIEPVGVDALVGMMTRSADYLRATDDGQKAIRPPEVIARDILARPTWNFPSLAGIVESPRVRPDGSILLTPGYDGATQLFLSPYPGWETFSVPDAPSNAEVEDAKQLLNELFTDFPFVGDADYANAVAFMLTPILRPAIAGSVPVAAFDALSKQGTGKSLLVRTCMAVATGRDPSMSAMPNDEAEWRKSLTALLMTGRDVIVFDNATGSVIESGVWANAVTNGVFDDRILGGNERADLRIRCTWAITGNAMCFGRDMIRRTYQILLDAGVECPEDRTGFKHVLPAWALDHRPALLRACLILCRRWWADCCPKARVPKWGGFEAFSEVVGSVLANVGIQGFITNRADFRDVADLERGEWSAFMTGLAEAFGLQKKFSCGDVVDRVEKSHALREALPAALRDAKESDRGFARRLGHALRKNAGSVSDRYRLVAAGRDSHSKKPLFLIEDVGSTTPRATEDSTPDATSDASPTDAIASWREPIEMA